MSKTKGSPEGEPLMFDKIKRNSYGQQCHLGLGLGGQGNAVTVFLYEVLREVFKEHVDFGDLREAAGSVLPGTLHSSRYILFLRPPSP